jgi:hypothetical protein
LSEEEESELDDDDEESGNGYEVYQEKGYLPDGPNSRIGLSLAEQGGSLISLLGSSGECLLNIKGSYENYS